MSSKVHLKSYLLTSRCFLNGEHGRTEVWAVCAIFNPAIEWISCNFRTRQRRHTVYHFHSFFKNPSTRKKKRRKSLIHEILKFQNWIVNGEILNLAPSRSRKGLCNWGEFDNWSLVGSLFGSSRTTVTCYYPYSSLKEKLKLNCWKDLKKKLLPPSIKRDESYDDLWEVVES